MPAVQNEESFVFLPQVVANYISKYLIASDLWPWHLTLCGFLQNTSFNKCGSEWSSRAEHCCWPHGLCLLPLPFSPASPPCAPLASSSCLGAAGLQGACRVLGEPPAAGLRTSSKVWG